jgi:hypothetical protein
MPPLPGSLPGAIWFAWLSQWIWAPFIGSVALLALVDPSGRLLSARWRPVAFGPVHRERGNPAVTSAVVGDVGGRHPRNDYWTEGVDTEHLTLPVR